MRTFHGTAIIRYIKCWCFKSHINYRHTESQITFCLKTRPLPEEEELEDELFAGTLEEQDPGNRRIENYCIMGTHLSPVAVSAA